MEIGSVRNYTDRYSDVFSEYDSNIQVNVLDIGGASGNFALAVKNHFGLRANVYVIDTTAYDTWEQEAYSSNITFIQDSVENLKAVFSETMKFDLIFCEQSVSSFREFFVEKDSKRNE